MNDAHRKARLKHLIANDYGRQVDFVNATGISKARISQMAGAAQPFGEDAARRLANELGLVAEWFNLNLPTPKEHRGGASVHDVITSDVGGPIELKGMRRLPVVGEVKGGDDGYLDEYQYPVGHGDGYIEFPTTDPNAYALRVRGDSMHPRYRAGEFVVIEPNIEPQEGDDVIVICHNGKKMLKQLNWRRDGEIQFLSVNNGYGPLTIPAREIESIQLVAGRARRNALKS